MESVTELLEMDFEMPIISEGTPVAFFPMEGGTTPFPEWVLLSASLALAGT